MFYITSISVGEERNYNENDQRGKGKGMELSKDYCEFRKEQNRLNERKWKKTNGMELRKRKERNLIQEKERKW